MSEQRRDRGFTLPELLITISMMGLMSLVLGAAITTIFRTDQAAGGRLNIARGEQSIDTWMPADLASVNLKAKITAGPDDAPDPYNLVTGFDPVDQDEFGSPCDPWSCSGSVDLAGRNELLLTWRTLVAGPSARQTKVSYRFVDTGAEYQLRRIECSGPVSGPATCTTVVVLHELADDWDMSATDELVFSPDDPEYENVAGQQVVVTINGGVAAASSGAGGGSDTITLTAGGIDMGVISATDQSGAPSFVREGTRCGGSIAILVDDSNSIGTTAMATVRSSVKEFIEAFRGTPVRLQVVRFGTTARVLGTGTTGDGLYDMSEDSQADALKAQITSANLSGSSGSAGGTNWEDAWYRALLNNGLAKASNPDTVVFFTDGVPTYYGRGGTVNGPGNAFTRPGFDAANAIVNTFRRPTPPSIIGVGVNGPDNGLNNNQTFATGETRTGKQILAHLVDGGNFVANEYTGSNAEQANLYILNGFSGLTAALKTVALKDCGGTLTIRTRLDDGTAQGQKFGPEVVYENQAGGPDTRTIATSLNFPTGTFDFEIATGSITTQVVPQVSSSLSGHKLSPRGWECRAGAIDLTEGAVPISSPDFQGLEITLNANQAVSCTMWVQPK